MEKMVHKIKNIFLAFCLLLSSSVVKAEPWNTTDKVLMGSFIGMQVIDVAQTQKAISLGHVEMNPILGPKPSTTKLIALKGVATGAVYWLVDTYPDSRRPMLILVNSLKAFVIRHNYMEAQVGFGF